MKKEKLIVLFAVLVVSVLLAACGGGGASAPEPVSLAFSGYDEFRYDPATASAPAGAQVTIDFTNEGVLDHDWLLVAEGTDLATVTAENAVVPEAHSGQITAGASNTFTFTAPAAGTYQFVCTVPGHAAAGMVGTFTVSQ